MAFLLLLRLSVDVTETVTRYEVTNYGHDTVTGTDVVRIAYSGTDPGPFDRDPAAKAGQYCSGTTLVEVYHSVARDGTSNRVRTTSAPACPVAALPVDPRTLLLRECDNTDPPRVLQTAYYYNPATGAVEVAGPTPTTSCAPFSRPTTQLVAAFCLTPGQPPYTERRLYHNGTGGLTTTDVINATACGLGAAPLTLAVAGQGDETGAGGDGWVLLRGTTGNGAALTYALDDFAAAVPSPSGYFVRLRAGIYTATVREEIPGGRRTRLSFAIAAPRGLRYVLPFKASDEVPWRVEFYLRGYPAGATATELTGTDDPVRLRWLGSAADHLFTNPLRGSEAEISVLVRQNGQELAALAAVDEQAVRVDVRRNATTAGGGELLWRGYLLPDLFDAPLLAAPYPLSLRATDGLGTLAGIPFADASGHPLPLGAAWSQRRIVQHILSLLDTALPLASTVNLRPDNFQYPGPGAPASAWNAATSDALAQAGHWPGGFVDEKGKAWNCDQVLRAVLGSYDAQLLQYGGAWHLRRLAELTPGPTRARWHGPDGTPLLAPGPASVLRVVGLPPPNQDAGNPIHYVEETQALSLRPAAGQVVLTAEPGPLLNLLPEGDHWPAAAFAGAISGLQRWPGTALNRRLAGPGQDEARLLLPGQVAPGRFLLSPVVQTAYAAGIPTFGPVVRVKATLRGVSQPDETLRPAPPYLFGLEALADGLPTRCEGVNVVPTRQSDIFTTGGFFPAVDKEIELLFYVSTPAGHVPGQLVSYQLRLLAPPAPSSVEIHSLRVEVGSDVIDLGGYQSAFAYVSEYRHTPVSGGRNTGKDEATLPVSDTPGGWLAHTPVLVASAVPVRNWQESAGAPGFEAGDLLGRDRVLWQTRPVRVLRGTLAGVFSPLALLYDQQQAAPPVYVPTSSDWRCQRGWWDITAVENLQLPPPLPPALPAALLLAETADPLLSETGAYLLSET